MSSIDCRDETKSAPASTTYEAYDSRFAMVMGLMDPPPVSRPLQIALRIVAQQGAGAFDAVGDWTRALA